MSAIPGMIISQLLEPITLAITVLTGAICWRPPRLYIVLVLAAVAKLVLLLSLHSTAAARYPLLLYQPS